jgi:hypothetical protein
VPVCKPVLEAAEAGSITLVTSAVTLVEVFWLKGHRKVDASHARKIEIFFRNSWIVVREVDRFIAEAARELL